MLISSICRRAVVIGAVIIASQGYAGPVENEPNLPGRIATAFNGLVGEYVYNDARTSLYPDGTLLSDMRDPYSRELKRVRLPSLSKLKITGYRYDDETHSMLIYLEASEHVKYISYSRVLYVGEAFSDPFLRYGVCLLPVIPNLSKRDLQDIRSGTLRVGMSEDALYMTLGYPDHTNHASYGDQEVYLSAFVYVTKGRVTGWQERN